MIIATGATPDDETRHSGLRRNDEGAIVMFHKIVPRFITLSEGAEHGDIGRCAGEERQSNELKVVLYVFRHILKA